MLTIWLEKSYGITRWHKTTRASDNTAAGTALNPDASPQLRYFNRATDLLPRRAAMVFWFAVLLCIAQLALADTAPTEVRMRTTAGDILLELNTEKAPETVANFLQYVDDGFYDGTIFHRVIEGFMIQGGGFTSSYDRKPTRAPIRNEANNGESNRRHTIAMARTNAPHSATAQFFINTVDNLPLDHTAATPRGWGYAVFGRVVGGHDIVDKISRVATGPGGPFSRDAPREQILIQSISRVGRSADHGQDAAPATVPADTAATGDTAEKTKPAQKAEN